MDADLNETTDELANLLLRCAAGDKQALRRVYDLQAPRLKALAMRVTGSPMLAEDVLHDVFLRVWQDAGCYDAARGTPRAWLTTLTRYRALEVMRRQGREVYVPDPPDQIDDSPDALARLAASTNGRALRRCLDTLEPARRRMIILAFVHGSTHAHLAQKLNVPLGTVKSHIRRSLAVLKRCLEQ